LQALRANPLETAWSSSFLAIHPLVISGTASDMIDILLGKDGGKITGTVRDDSQQIMSGIPVVLIPDRRDRHDIYKYIFTDAAVISHLAPFHRPHTKSSLGVILNLILGSIQTCCAAMNNTVCRPIFASPQMLRWT